MKIAPISTNNIYANFLSKKKPMKKEDNNPDTFSKTNAGKHFIKGVISPVTNVIKHPVTSLCAFGVVAGVCSLVPVLSSVLTIGFGVFSVAGLCKSTYNAAKFYKDKEYRKSEESFEGIGQGALTTLLTAFGLKQSAKTVKEAKLMEKLNVTSLDNAAKRAMAREVKYDGYFGAVKENFSLFTTKEGFNALKNQFSFRNIKSRAVDIFKFITKGNKNVIRDIKSERVDFKSTEQYKKRAGQTTEEIKAESQQIVDDIFKEFGYDKAQTPNVLIFSDDIEQTGYYVKELHLIELNEVSHKEGLVNIREVLGHEAVHAREQILRNCLKVGS